MQSPGPIRRGKRYAVCGNLGRALILFLSSLHACLEEDVTSEETALYAAFINHVLASDRLHIPSLPIPTDNPQVCIGWVDEVAFSPSVVFLKPEFSQI